MQVTAEMESLAGRVAAVESNAGSPAASDSGEEAQLLAVRSQSVAVGTTPL